MIEEDELCFTEHDLNRHIDRALSESYEIIEDGMRTMLNMEESSVNRTIDWLNRARAFLHKNGRLPMSDHVADANKKEQGMTGYHVTTAKKIQRYKNSSCILPPVRFWPNVQTAERWAKRTGRSEILQIEVDESYQLPDHKPARWSPNIIRSWRNINDF